VVEATVLVSDARGAPELLLVLGRYGIGRVVDVRVPTGGAGCTSCSPCRGRTTWGACSPSGSMLATCRRACARSSRRCSPCRPPWPRCAPSPRGWACRRRRSPSRFLRAGLPSPKRYLAFARLVRAARLLEAPGRSLAATALALDYSSAQSFNRHVQGLLGLPACEFRRRYDGRAMLARLCTDLVLPHVTALEALDGGRLPRSAAP
jgi:AraC-like DNA-binding protein